MPVVASAPMVLQETLIFPYLSGAEFMRDFESREPGKQPYSDMPASTTQIMHPLTDYFGTRDWPTRVDATAAAAWYIAVQYNDDLGEFETRLFLYQHLERSGCSDSRGDRVGRRSI